MKNCKVHLGKDVMDGIFLGVFQYSEVLDPSPMIGGHSGGVIANPVAVVQMDNKLRKVKLRDVSFEDNEDDLPTEGTYLSEANKLNNDISRMLKGDVE